MAKYYGILGFVKTYEKEINGVPSGEYVTDVIERHYRGDILQDNRRWSDSTEKVNEDVTINNRFSILIDSFISDNLSYLKYINYFGADWKISSVEIQYPRMILTTGGLYNG